MTNKISILDFSRFILLSLAIGTAACATPVDKEPSSTNSESLRQDDRIQQYLKGQSHKIVESGEFWGIRIGDSKDSVFKQIKALGIKIIGLNNAGAIPLNTITPDASRALHAERVWIFHNENSEGFWRIELIFKEATLSAITIDHSPHEFL